MEGDLLELTVDEVQQLWSVLQQDSELLASFERCRIVKGVGGGGGTEEGLRVARKRKETSPTTSITSSTGSVEGASSKVPPSKRRKRLTRSITPKSSPSPAPSNTLSHSKLVVMF